MKKTDINNIIRSSKVIIHKQRYAYLRTEEKELNDHFFISQDKDETTVVTTEKRVKNVKYKGIEKWFRLIEIQVSVPFTQGFLAKVTSILASKGLNTLVISTFSKDYILTKEKGIDEAVKAMKKAGFKVTSCY